MRKKTLTISKIPSRIFYSVWQIRLHWLVVCILPLLLVANQDIKSDWQIAVTNSVQGHNLSFGSWVHIVCGIAVLFFMLWRAYLRFLNAVAKEKSINKKDILLELIKNSIIYSIYIIIIIMGITGVLGWFAVMHTVMELHSKIAPIVITLLMFHILGIMFYEGILGKKIIRKMIPKTKNKPHP